MENQPVIVLVRSTFKREHLPHKPLVTYLVEGLLSAQVFCGNLVSHGGDIT